MRVSQLLNLRNEILIKKNSLKNLDEAAYNAIQRKYELEIGADLMKQNDSKSNGSTPYLIYYREYFYRHLRAPIF